MATEKTDNSGERPMSMKERLMAQRRAAAEGKGDTEAKSAPPMPAAKPVAKPATRAAQPAAEPAARAAASARSTARPAAARAARAAPAAMSATSAPRRDAKAMSADVAREVELLRKRQDKLLMYGWIVAGVMLLIAGGAYGYSTAQVDARKAAVVLYEKTMNDLRAEFDAMDINSIDAAKKVIERAEATKDTIQLPNGKLDAGWKDTYVAGVASKVQAKSGQAASFIRKQEEQNELLAGLGSLEAAVRDAANKKPEELASLRRRLSEYSNRASVIGPEFEARVSRASIDLDRAIAQRLFDEARAVAAKGEARAAMTAYAKAEDELRALMDEAYSKRNQDAISWVEPLYEQCIKESDKIVYAAFTPENIDKIPWLDVLASSEIKWGDDGLTGFRHDASGLQAIGSEPGSKREGVFSVGDLEYWRDFVMEIEFTPVRGRTTLYWRLGKLVQAAPDELAIDPADGNGYYKAGTSYSMTATYIGSTYKWAFSPNTEREDVVLDDGIQWRRNRVGAFGAVLAEGAEFKISKLRIKVLRAGRPR